MALFKYSSFPFLFPFDENTVHQAVTPKQLH